YPCLATVLTLLFFTLRLWPLVLSLSTLLNNSSAVILSLPFIILNITIISPRNHLLSSSFKNDKCINRRALGGFDTDSLVGIVLIQANDCVLTEPNSYPHRTGRSVSGTQLGHDFMALAQLLESQGLRSASVYGPDVTRPRRSCLRLLHFLETAARVVGAVTWHHYYVNGRTATLHDFLDPKLLDSLVIEIQDVAQVVQKVSPGSKVWLGETSSAWGGGAAGLSDSYVAGFMWLDKLGLSARLGIDVVIRQAFVGHGHYTLVDKENEPLPSHPYPLPTSAIAFLHLGHVCSHRLPSLSILPHKATITLFLLTFFKNSPLTLLPQLSPLTLLPQFSPHPSPSTLLPHPSPSTLLPHPSPSILPSPFSINSPLTSPSSPFSLNSPSSPFSLNSPSSPFSPNFPL
uniref:Heparanase n=1 Tax=Eptatretus burgeri TaxID=7764 RepID=A0A8C4QIF4_EPTBU